MTKSPLNLTIPGGLAATLVLRPAAPRTGASVKGLTGSDIALWLTVMHLSVYHATGGSMRIEQRLITHRFGRITRDRMLDAMRRLTGSELYLAEEDRWVPAIVASYEHPMSRQDPRVPVAPEWRFDIDEDLASAWCDGIAELPVHVPCGPMRELTSRYAMAAWLKFLVWPKRKGIVPPDHWNLLMPAKGTGMRLDVPTGELGEFFGYDGSLAPSKVAALFTTGSDNHPVVERELIRVGIDFEMVPIMSTWHSKPVAFRVRTGGRYLPIEHLTDGRWTETRAVSRPKRGKGKLARKAIA